MTHFIGFAEAEKQTGLGKPYLIRLIKAGKGPPHYSSPGQHGGTQYAFEENEFKAWFERHKAGKKPSGRAAQKTEPTTRFHIVLPTALLESLGKQASAAEMTISEFIREKLSA